MRNWENYTISIGEVRQHSTQFINFKSLRTLNISRIQPTCTSCTKFIDYKDNILTIRYDAEEYPKHLIGTGNKPIVDNDIYVYYEDGSMEKLKFIGFITR